MKKKSKLKFYFSFRSPYSWFGAVLLNQKLKGWMWEEIEIIPFFEPDDISEKMLLEKDGEFPYVPMSHAKHLYILQDVKRISKRLHLDVKWPVDKNPCWEIPHLAYLEAKKWGKEQDFFWAVYKKRWEEGKNICSEETIAEIAEQLSLDPILFSQAYKNQERRNEGLQSLMKVDKDGVFGVPFFMNGFRKFWGVDRLADFISSLDLSDLEHENIVSSELLSPIGCELDHAGGCG